MTLIKDRKTIETLYKEGKISRTTYWRARERGWIKYKWQNPHSEVEPNWEFYDEDIQETLVAIAKWYLSMYELPQVDHRDMVQDVLLYLYEKGYSENRSKGWVISNAKSWIRHKVLYLTKRKEQKFIKGLLREEIKELKEKI